MIAIACSIRARRPFNRMPPRSRLFVISRSWSSNASSRTSSMAWPFVTLSGTKWKIVRWESGMRGSVRPPVVMTGTPPVATSSLGAKVRMPSSSRNVMPYSLRTLRARWNRRRGARGSVRRKVTESALAARPGATTKDMPRRSPNTSLMKVTNGRSWKLTSMGGPASCSPRRSAAPSARRLLEHNAGRAFNAQFGARFDGFRSDGVCWSFPRWAQGLGERIDLELRTGGE